MYTIYVWFWPTLVILHVILDVCSNRLVLHIAATHVILHVCSM